MHNTRSLSISYIEIVRFEINGSTFVLHVLNEVLKKMAPESFAYAALLLSGNKVHTICHRVPLRCPGGGEEYARRGLDYSTRLQ